MKKEIFKWLVERVCAVYEISKPHLITKSKSPVYARPRQMLVHLCVEIPIERYEIINEFERMGMTLHYSTLSSALKRSYRYMKEDSQYNEVFNKIIKEYNEGQTPIFSSL